MQPVCRIHHSVDIFSTVLLPMLTSRYRPVVVHPDRFFRELLASLELPYVGACWHLTDPEAGDRSA